MFYEVAGFLAVVFVGLVLYASVTMDIRNSYTRFRSQQLKEVRVAA